MQPRFLLITFPAQGHINPALQFAKRLVGIGAHVTFATSVCAHRRMKKVLSYPGLSLVTYSDGYDDGFKPGDSHDHYMSEIRCHGLLFLSQLIVSAENEGNPYTCLIYTLLLPWAVEAAREHHLPHTLLWIQPATVLDIYYYYFNGYSDIFERCEDPSYVPELPGLPPLTSKELPSFLVPSNAYKFILSSFQEQLEILIAETKPKILVNTFDALEPKALKAIEKFDTIGVGPLIPSAFLDGKDPSDISFGGDLFKTSKDYTEWLNSKPKSSVIYVSFGTLVVLSKQQMEEVAIGLLDSGHPFLWVIRDEDYSGNEIKEEKLSCRELLEEEGMIVPWCSQVEVLSHPSIGCFVTHCGWNSTSESVVSGVPMVAFPQWTDQGTNAKLIEEVWKVGVRVKANEEGTVERHEIRRCVDLVLESETMRRNAHKWKEMAREAVREGGSSDKNLKGFVDELCRREG